MNRIEKYKEVIPQIRALLEEESHLISDLANITALLKETFGFFWIGFYFSDEQGDLYLGPFQGPLACTNISLGKGVCGTSAKEQKTIIVPDVHEFPGHITCNTVSKSEIVVPLISANQCKLVLDIDSEMLNNFNYVDQDALELIIEKIKIKHY